MHDRRGPRGGPPRGQGSVLLDAAGQIPATHKFGAGGGDQPLPRSPFSHQPSPEAQNAREDAPAREVAPQFDRAALSSLGFAGFISVEDLWNRGCQSVPITKGIYAVLRDDLTPPTFLATSGGGHFKGDDPSVTISELEANWVSDAYVLYIGQAGGGQSNNALRDRVTSLVRFANGKAVGHWGGRLLWQVEGSQGFLVAWKVNESDDPRDQEAILIEAFRQLYGRLPFANLKA